MRLCSHPSELEEDGRPILLMLRALKLGDLLVAVPAIHGLRRAYPQHMLVLAVPAWLRPIAELIDGVDALWPTPGLDQPLPIAPRTVDIAVNLHGNGPESRAIIDALAPRLKIVHSGDDGAIPWRDGILERERWAALVNAYGAEADSLDVGIRAPHAQPPVRRAVVVHVGAFYGSRAWPAERFAEVLAALADDGATVVITGGDADRQRGLAIAELAGISVDRVLAGRIDLAEFAATVSAASLVITVDTGAAHLASAYRTPSVVIFGPAPPEEWGPPPGPHRVLTDARLRRGETFAEDPDPALLAVQAEDVLREARALLKAS